MLIFHFIGLALSFGSMITFLVIRRSCSKVTFSESESLHNNIKQVMRLSHIGLGVMLITGGYLMTPYWALLGKMPLLHIKFTVYIIWYITLIVLSLYLRKARQSQLKICDPRIGFLNFVSLIFGLIAMSMAVIQFQ